MTRAPALAILVLALASCGVAEGAPPSSTGVRLATPRKGITEGEVEVPGTPAAVYVALTRYQDWPSIFPHYVAAELMTPGDRAIVRVTTRKRRSHELRFDNQPQHHRLRFVQTDRRGEARVEVVLSPAVTPGRTLLRARVTLRAAGLAGRLASEGTLRAKRERRLIRDLELILLYLEQARP